MDALFIFPPGWNPCSPYLAHPILKAYLAGQGHNISLIDSNVDFFDYILSPSYLKACLEKDYAQCVTTTVKTTLSMCSGCIDEIDYAKATMRSYQYLDLSVRKHVDTILSNALYIINNTTMGLNVSFNKIELNYSRTSSKSVYNACYDDVLNPYIDYFKSRVLPQIKNSGIKVVGISVTGHTQLISALTLCRLIKETCPNVKHIMLGGNYITRSAQQIFACGFFDEGFFDSIICSDGEIPCAELLNAISNGHLLDEVHSIMFLRNGKLISTQPDKTYFINHCTPDFSGLPLNLYFAPSIIFPIFTSRSCYNKCAFCTIPNATNGKYRALPIDKVISNISALQEIYNAGFFVIVDETFDIQRMLLLAKAIISKGLNIFWYCETRFSKMLSLDECKILHQSGCRQIQFGLESYNQRVLDKMEKNIRIENIDESIVNCMRAGISVHLFFFTGFPTETKEEALRTFEYTAQKVTESQTKYNVISSRGYGTFGLEIGSSVWLYPDKFSIEIFQNEAENDLRLNVDYITKTGLSQEESENLVSSQNLRDGIKPFDTEEYELPWMDFIPEVHMVVKAAVAPGVEVPKIKKMIGKYLLNDLLSQHLIGLSPHVVVTGGTNKIFLYNRRIDRAYILPSSILLSAIHDHLFPASEVFNLRSNDALQHISNLIYHGFLEIDNVAEEFTENWNEAGLKLLKANSLHKYYNAELNEWVLFNRISRSSVAVSPLAYSLLDLFIAPLGFSDAIDLLRANGIDLPQDLVFSLIDYYLKHDILYVLQ